MKTDTRSIDRPRDAADTHVETAARNLLRQSPYRAIRRVSCELRDGVLQLAEQIKAIYDNRPITIVAILTGSLVFLADLIRQLEMPLRVALETFSP